MRGGETAGDQENFFDVVATVQRDSQLAAARLGFGADTTDQMVDLGHDLAVRDHAVMVTRRNDVGFGEVVVHQ